MPVYTWQAAPLMNNSRLARNDVQRYIVDKFQAQLFSLNETAEGRHMSGRIPIPRFVPATDKTYLPAIKLIEAFSNDVRDIKC